MFCPECGTKAPDGARFCGNCRHNLQPMASGQDSATQESAAFQTSNPGNGVLRQGKPSDEVSPLLKWGIVASGLLMPFIPVIMGIIYLNRNDASEDTKAVGKMWLIVGGVFFVLWAIGSGGY